MDKIEINRLPFLKIWISTAKQIRCQKWEAAHRTNSPVIGRPIVHVNYESMKIYLNFIDISI